MILHRGNRRLRHRLKIGLLANILTPRQLQYAKLVSWGLTTREIAKRAGVAESTVGQRLVDIYCKADMGQTADGYLPRVQLAVRYIQENFKNKRRSRRVA